MVIILKSNTNSIHYVAYYMNIVISAIVHKKTFALWDVFHNKMEL